jgi:hypothetical protein
VASVYLKDLDLDLDLEFEPCIKELKVKKVGDKIVVGYIAYDNSSCNPLEDFEGQGGLLVTESACHHIGLVEFKGRFSKLKLDLEADGIIETVAEIIKEEIRQTPEMIPWAVKLRLELGAEVYLLLAEKLAGVWQNDIEWSDVDEDYIGKLKVFEVYAEEAWERLYAQGKIGTPLAIPVRYEDCYRVSVYPCSIEEANAVWVPDKCCLENISRLCAANASYPERLKVAKEYAKNVLEEYEKWCNGEVFGVIIETFDEAGEHIDTESCWGIIGEEYADEELESCFKSTCEYLEKTYAEEVRTQCGQQVELPLAA